MKRLCVCIVSREYPPETGWGGIGTYTYSLAHGLSELGHEVHVVAQSLDVDREYRDGPVFVHRIAHRTIFYHKGPLKEFGLRLEYSSRVNAAVRSLTKKFGFDIIEGPNFSAEMFVYSLCKAIPVVTRLHTHFSEVVTMTGRKHDLDFSLSCSLEDALILRSSRVSCSTRMHAQLIAHESGKRVDEIEIIPLGVSLPVLAHHEYSDSTSTVLFVGRMEKRKGIQVLMKAIPSIVEAIPNVHFNIIGRDTFVNDDFVSLHGSPHESFKENMIKSLPGRYLDNISFLGYVDSDRLSSNYRTCDIFVAPSLYESFGLIYLEAMSYAKPVIGCAVGGVPEVVRDGETGILVPPEDPVSLAHAVIRLLKNRTERISLGAAARKQVEASFTNSIMAQRTEMLYKKILKRE